MKAQKNETLVQTIIAALEPMRALTSPSDFNTLANRKTPRNASQAEHIRALANVVAEKVAEFDAAAGAFFALADCYRADLHLAGKDVALARKRARMAVLNGADKEFVRAVRKRGNMKCDGLWNDLSDSVSLTRDELIEASNF